jgi:hypothetical protein
MNDELQEKMDDSVVDDSVSVEETQDADLAPATGEDQFSPDKQSEEKQDSALTEGAQKAINKQHFKYQEEKRKREAIEKEKADIESRLKAYEAEKSAVVIPDIPDVYDFGTDEEYRQAIADRENAIRQAAKVEAQKEIERSQLERQQKDNEAKEQQQARQMLQNYAENAIALGLESSELRQAEDLVNQYQFDPQVSKFVMKDKDGPLIVKYLAANPLLMDELTSMEPVEAVIKIHSDIKTAASQLKPRPSAAPPPPDLPDSHGAPEQLSPLIAGGRFE